MEKDRFDSMLERFSSHTLHHWKIQRPQISSLTNSLDTFRKCLTTEESQQSSSASQENNTKMVIFTFTVSPYGEPKSTQSTSASSIFSVSIPISKHLIPSKTFTTTSIREATIAANSNLIGSSRVKLRHLQRHCQLSKNTIHEPFCWSMKKSQEICKPCTNQGSSDLRCSHPSYFTSHQPVSPTGAPNTSQHLSIQTPTDIPFWLSWDRAEWEKQLGQDLWDATSSSPVIGTYPTGAMTPTTSFWMTSPGKRSSEYLEEPSSPIRPSVRPSLRTNTTQSELSLLDQPLSPGTRTCSMRLHFPTTPTGN